MKLNRTAVFALGLAAGFLLAIALTTTAQTGGSARPPLPLDELRTFAEVYGAMKAGYVEAVDDKKAIASCITGMISSLDDRSAYYDAAAFRELQVPSSAAGTGLELAMDAGFAKVVSPIEGTPASRAGIRSGDLISRIDDQPVKGLTLEEVVKRLRGKPGTEVKLTLTRAGEAAPREVTLKRELIRINPVRAAVLPDGVAYLRVSAFQDSSPQRLATELARLWGEGHAIKGMILDLRNNPGGLLFSAVGSSAIFLPEGAAIGSTDGRTEEAKRSYAAKASDFLRGAERDYRASVPPQVAGLPLAVLVNRGSAAGTEFLAGALQDHKRAVVVGEKTFGRGSVQTIYPLAEGKGALKLTSAYWVRPNGRKIEGAGVEPDVAVDGDPVAVPDPPDPARDPVLARAVASLKR
jgi:carboxyl-terminal processing protease